MEETEATPLPDDVVREILLRVPTIDVVALFRCAVTCKQWRAFVADLSFLRHHWPENSPHPSSLTLHGYRKKLTSSLLGFFDQQYDEPPLFSPVSPGSVLGSHRRSLTSFVHGARDGILDGAMPLAARGGLLLVRLAVGRLVDRHFARDSLHLAVCHILTGTCEVLPPLECKVFRCGCAVLAREDLCSPDGQQGRRTPSTGYLAVFKVLAMVIGARNDQDCNLYTFSSSEPNWSKPRRCFDEAWQRDAFGLRTLTATKRAVVCRGVAYWLGSYSTDPWSLPRYFTFGVDVMTGQISSTEISIPANQLADIGYFGLMLSVAVGEKLSLLHLQKEGFRLNIWTRGDDGSWLRTRAIQLKPPEQPWNPVRVTILSGEKSSPFL
ncbi:hypothetical protein ACQ4PT_049898 [Festuca glaucescens]